MKKIFGIIFLAAFVLIGCTEKSNVYSGIEKNDIAEISKAENIDFVYEYKAHTDQWAANYVVYKMKDTDNHTSRLLLKYLGMKHEPLTGEFKYAFQTQGGGDGSGTMSNAEIESEIIRTGTSGGNGALAAQDSIVQLQVYWNDKKESLELQPVTTK